MKSLTATIAFVACAAAFPVVANAAQDTPPCNCDCPSLEDQVEERLSKYKAELDAQVQELQNALKDQLNQKRVDELKDKIQQLFDDMLKDFGQSPPPKELVI